MRRAAGGWRTGCGGRLDVSIEETPDHPVVSANGAARARTDRSDLRSLRRQQSRSSSGRPPPFEPEIVTVASRTRSVDDKGQLYLHVKAIEAHMKTRGKLPVNVIVLGEEEIRSINLIPFVEAHAERLKADRGHFGHHDVRPDIPTIGVSLRKKDLYFEIEVRGPARMPPLGELRRRRRQSATALSRIIASFRRRLACRDPRVLMTSTPRRSSGPDPRSSRSTRSSEERAHRRLAARPGIHPRAALGPSDRRGERPRLRLHGEGRRPSSPPARLRR